MDTVVFDLDGTLADTSGDLIAAANACFRNAGAGDVLDMARDRMAAFHGGRVMLRLGLSRLKADWNEADVDRLFPGLLAYYGRNIDRFTRLYDGVEDALDRLKSEGVALGVCTNKPVALAESLLRRLGISGHFGAVLGADSLSVRKPDPEHLLQTILRVGGEPDRAVLVGDTLNDRDTARAANVPCILVTFGPQGRRVERMKPEGLLHCFGDLTDVLSRIRDQRE
ncbi:MAG: HAD-IA family hydrolase [Paracoccaceae bacterium]